MKIMISILIIVFLEFLWYSFSIGGEFVSSSYRKIEVGELVYFNFNFFSFLVRNWQVILWLVSETHIYHRHCYLILVIYWNNRAYTFINSNFGVVIRCFERTSNCGYRCLYYQERFYHHHGIGLFWKEIAGSEKWIFPGSVDRYSDVLRLWTPSTYLI